MNTHTGTRAHALNNQIAMLVNDIIYDAERDITANVYEYQERYLHIRASVTMTSMSHIDLNMT